MGGGVGGDTGDGSGGEDGGVSGGVGGGGDGGGDGEGDAYFRGPQSSQSVPRSHWPPSAPACPSWQWPLLINCWPPVPKGLRQVLSQSIGGEIVLLLT